MYYALTDTATGNNPKEHTHGFANTKGALAFRTRTERDTWLATTKLLTAAPLTRAEAIRLAEKADGNLAGIGDKIVPIYGTEKDGHLPEYHVIQKNRSAW